MNNFFNAENFEYQPHDFYISQIERLIEISSKNPKIEAWAPAIVSFFSGKVINSNSENPPVMSAVHIHALSYAKDCQKLKEYFESNYINIAIWVERLFYYFRIVDGFPIITKELIDHYIICKVLEILEGKKVKTHNEKVIFLRAYVQILPYAEKINSEKTKLKCIEKINYNFEMKKLTLENTIFLLTTRIIKANMGNKSYYQAIDYLKELIIKINLNDNISILNSIYFEDREFLLNNIEIVKLRIIESVQNNQHNNSLGSFIINLFDDKLFFIIRDIYASVNLEKTVTTNIENHIFTIVNSSEFLAGNEISIFEYDDQFTRYRELISSQNIYLNSYTSLAFDTVEYNSEMDFSRYHIANNSLDDFIEKTINCYRVREIDYTSFKSVTFLPIDTHPIQACITVNNNYPPPLINTSFDGKNEIKEKNKILCFLTKGTRTYDDEVNFINSLPYDSKIITDPNLSIFFDSINSLDYDILYISAHGGYEHFESYYEDIIFQDDNGEEIRISSNAINERLALKDLKKILILNICDGANSGLSFLVSNRGIANSFTKKSFCTLSYIWPVEPVFAAIFGTLVLKKLKHSSLNEAYFHTFTLLNDEITSICEKLNIENSHFWEDRIKNYSGHINDHANLYAIAMYT